MVKFFLTLLTFAITLIANAATTNPLWLRYNAISPKGDKIAFSYNGDIYLVDSKGGEARSLTSSSSHDYNPVWSNDGTKIAFASNKYGNWDIFVAPVTGGPATRITTNSASEIPLAFSNNDKEIYFSSSLQESALSAVYPGRGKLYRIAVEGGRPTQVFAVSVEGLSFSKDGKSFLYYDNKGMENVWRKHHTSSVARNISLYSSSDDSHKQLTTNAGEDRSPIFTPDNKSMVFLSERDGGSFNVYKSSLDAPENVTAITSFKTHPVRFLSQANDGTLCYNYHGEIYTQNPNGKPTKVNISIVDDKDESQNLYQRVTSGGSEITKDGKQVAFTVRGEVFVTTSEYSTTKRITNTAEAERNLSFSPDGRSLAYDSERNGVWNIYIAKIAREEEVNFANATVIDEQPLFAESKIERLCPTYSPDGKEIAFVENRNQLKVINLATKKVRMITNGKQNPGNNDYGLSYSWSPDGKWFVIDFITSQHEPYSDVGIVSAVDGGKIHNITNSGYTDSFLGWAMDGNAILFGSERLGMRNHASWGSMNDVFIAFLNQDSYDKFRMTEEEYKLMKEEEERLKKGKKEAEAKNKKDEKSTDKKSDDKGVDTEKAKDIVIDFESIDKLIVRLTPMSSDLAGAILSKDGETLYFLSAFEDGYDLWKTDIRSRSTSIFKKGIGYGNLVLNDKGTELFLLGGNSQKITLSSGKSTPIRSSSELTMDLAAERAYMFNRVINQEKKRFYNTNMHGIDMDFMQKEYAPFLDYINNNHDFSEMLSELLGELNVSHTGSGYRAPAVNGATSTAELGLLFNLDYNKDGLLIDEVLEKGPFSKDKSKVRKGDIIEKIDGNTIKSGVDYYPLLDKKAGKNTLITIYNPTTKERWDEVIKPINKGAMNGLLYTRWVESREKEVARLSNGRLGYVHIPSMDDASFRPVYSDILGKFNHCDAIVIDVRYNGGGRLHEDIEALFSGTKYLEQVIRGEKSCDMPSRRWTKPSIMLICEADYSNAHGTPWVYKHMGIGKLVGMPVPGTMTSVNWETLQDPTLYFGIPVIGYRTEDGTYLENFQLEPDIKVANSPEKVAKGIDSQLETAVKELLKEVDAKKGWGKK